MCWHLFLEGNDFLKSKRMCKCVICVVVICRQYYSSCKTGNMDSALSIWFLLLWLGGDMCNLVGSFLADQLPLQVNCDEILASVFSLSCSRAASQSITFFESIDWSVKCQKQWKVLIRSSLKQKLYLKTVIFSFQETNVCILCYQ